MIDQDDDRCCWLAQHVLPHERALRGMLARWALPPDLDVDDIVQEVYGRIMAMPSVEGVLNPRGYMFGIARAILLMHLRHARVVSILAVEHLDQIDVAAEEPSPEEQVSSREELHQVALAIARIEEPWRSAFLLRVTEDLTHKQIGERLGMSENAVQKSNARTLFQLMKIFGQGGNRISRASTWRDGKDSGAHARN